VQPGPLALPGSLGTPVSSSVYVRALTGMHSLVIFINTHITVSLLFSLYYVSSHPRRFLMSAVCVHQVITSPSTSLDGCPSPVRSTHAHSTWEPLDGFIYTAGTIMSVGSTRAIQ